MKWKEAKMSKENMMSEVKERIKVPALTFNRQYMNNTKLNQRLSTKLISMKNEDNENGLVRFSVSVENNTNLSVEVWQDEDVNVVSEEITQFDMAVLDAVYTIMCAGYDVFTLEGVGKVMSGNKAQKITPSKLVAIEDSIEKMRCTHIRIDCEEQFRSRKDTRDMKYIYESYFLPANRVSGEYEANGKSVTAYQIIEKSGYYKYAENLHQIVDFDAELLDTHTKFTDTFEAILIKRYVIKRVELIKSANNLKNNKISYDWYDKSVGVKKGLFADLGYIPNSTANWRDKKKRINRIVKLTLQSLKEKNAIVDFVQYKAGGSKNPTLPVGGYQVICTES